MVCEVCGGNLKEKGGEYECEKCKHKQKIGKKQWTYPLSDEAKYPRSY